MADGSQVKKMHHVAVAVENAEAAARFYRDVLGLEVVHTLTLPDRGLKVTFIRAGDTEIELLEPTSPESTVRRFLDRHGPGLHHICFEVDDIDGSMRHLTDRGAEFIDPVPHEGAVGLVAFMPPAIADGVLVELTQVKAVPAATTADLGALEPPSPGVPPIQPITTAPATDAATTELATAETTIADPVAQTEPVTATHPSTTTSDPQPGSHDARPDREAGA